MTAPAELNLSLFRHVDDKSRLLTKSPHYGKLFEIYESMLDVDFVRQGITMLEERMWAELRSRSTELTREFTSALEKSGAPKLMNSGAPKIHSSAVLKTGFKDYYARGKAENFDANRKHANINKGLLTTILERVEKAHGFAPVSYAWGTSGEAFLANLKARRPFKDYGAAPNHGDNTHRVQWFIICTSLCAGIADAAKFYEETAYWTTTVRFPKNSGGFFLDGNHTVYLWDFLCDSASNTTGWNAADAKGLSPIYIMTQLQEDDYPLLSNFVKYRKHKDETSGASQGIAGYADTGVALKTLHRAALRFHNTPFAQLSPVQKRALAESLGSAGFTDKHGAGVH
jgi:hypothetical protein